MVWVTQRLKLVIDAEKDVGMISLNPQILVQEQRNYYCLDKTSIAPVPLLISKLIGSRVSRIPEI